MHHVRLFHHGGTLLQKYVLRPRVLGLAAEVAFWLFLSLLPLVAVAGLLAAKLFLGKGADVEAFLGAVPDAVRGLVLKELSQVVAIKENTIGPVGAVVYVWLASSGVHALFDAFEAMTGTSRSWVRNRLTALLSCVALSLGVAGLAFLSGGVQWLRSIVEARSVPLSSLGLPLRFVLSAALVFSIVAGLYAVGVPKETRRTLPIIPGAALATMLQAVLAFAYALLVKLTGDGSAYVAGLAAIGVTMTTVYLYVLAILLGFALNQGWSSARSSPGDPAAAARALHKTAS